MHVPEEFDYLTSCFWNGSLERANSLDEWVENAVRLLNSQQKAVVKPFLDDVLSRDLPDKELQSIWRGGGACYGFPDTNELRRVLRVIQQKLAAPRG